MAEYAAAADTHQRLGARGLLARTRFDWAQALLATGGDAEGAGTLLAQARATAEELGMHGILRRAPVSFEGRGSDGRPPRAWRSSAVASPA
jgi:hypothetical protein